VLTSNPKRRNSRGGAVPSPAPPISPAANLGRQRGAPKKPRRSLIPSTLFAAAPLPTLDEATQLQLSTVTDPTERVRVAADFVFACLNHSASHAHIEKQLRIPPGALGGILRADRALTQRLQMSLIENANALDHQARQILATVANSPVRAIESRALLNYVGSLRCQGERLARLSESLGRKVVGSPGREEAKRQVKAKASLAAAQPTIFADRLRDDVKREKWRDLITQTAALHPGQVARLQSLIPWAEEQIALHKRHGADAGQLEAELAKAKELVAAQPPAPQIPTTAPRSNMPTAAPANHQPTITDEYQAAHPEAAIATADGSRANCYATLWLG
jgi:hypothetical protein